MAEKEVPVKLAHDSKQLAILIYDFLLQERDGKRLTKNAKHSIDRAADALEKVYDIKFTDYVFTKLTYPLQKIFAFGYHPVPVRNRIAAEKCKRQGNNFMDADLYVLAEDEYTKAIRLDPRNAVYYCNRAATRIRQGHFPDAVSDCNKALELDRHYAKAYGWLGIAHAMMDHSARAVRCYRKALRIEPGNQACLENIDLINKKINHAAFRVLEPLYTCRRNLARIATNIANSPYFFKRKNDGDEDKFPLESKSNDFQIERFCLGGMD